MAEVEASHNFAQAEEEVRFVWVDLCLRVAYAFPPCCSLLPSFLHPSILILLFSFISFSQILKLWEELGAFEQSLKLSEGRPEFTFYDGPPFATGLPHYGTSPLVSPTFYPSLFRFR